MYDSASMRQLADIDLGREPAPDETSICKFRHLLERHELGRSIFEAMHDHFEACAVQIATGTIVDVTIVGAPSSTKNKAGARDPGMHQTR